MVLTGILFSLWIKKLQLRKPKSENICVILLKSITVGLTIRCCGDCGSTIINKDVDKKKFMLRTKHGIKPLKFWIFIMGNKCFK